MWVGLGVGVGTDPRGRSFQEQIHLLDIFWELLFVCLEEEFLY